MQEAKNANDQSPEGTDGKKRIRGAVAVLVGASTGAIVTQFIMGSYGWAFGLGVGALCGVVLRWRGKDHIPEPASAAGVGCLVGGLLVPIVTVVSLLPRPELLWDFLDLRPVPDVGWPRFGVLFSVMMGALWGLFVGACCGGAIHVVRWLMGELPKKVRDESGQSFGKEVRSLFWPTFDDKPRPQNDENWP